MQDHLLLNQDPQSPLRSPIAFIWHDVNSSHIEMGVNL